MKDMIEVVPTKYGHEIAVERSWQHENEINIYVDRRQVVLSIEEAWRIGTALRKASGDQPKERFRGDWR